MTHHPIRYALTGVGRISTKHLDAVRDCSPAFELVALCDTNPSALAAVVSHPGVKTYDDFEAMLAEQKPDIVALCTPSGLHAAQGILAAKAGSHVITEKPMATRWEDGLMLEETCRKHGVQLFVVLQNRYNPTIEALKKAIDAERFGRIYMITGNVFWTRPQSYYDQAPWRGTWALDGGAFMNQASHYVDMMGYLGGAVKKVHASLATLARRIEAEDTGSVVLTYESGAIGNLNVTMLTYPKNREGSITVLGERGFVRIGGTAMNEIEAWEFDQPQPEDEGVAGASYAADSVYGNGHSRFYRGVVQALTAQIKPEIDGKEGLKSLELLSAIYASAQDEKTIMLPLARHD
jgi:UDP-N-acetyl-2-amino-2-deoxyglucuronate dehydrogenase